MSSPAKFQILAETLKQKAPFKAVKIYQPLGLSASLVQYHLGVLVNEGYIEKDRAFYCIVDRDGLIDHLANVSEQKMAGLLTRDFKFTQEKTNVLVTDLIHLRSLRAPGSKEVIKATGEMIDGAIKALTQLKRYLLQKEVGETKARKQVLSQYEEDNDYFWKSYSTLFLAAGIDKKTFMDWLEKVDANA